MPGGNQGNQPSSRLESSVQSFGQQEVTSGEQWQLWAGRTAKIFGGIGESS
jgi:hypothetical protein